MTDLGQREVTSRPPSQKTRFELAICSPTGLLKRCILRSTSLSFDTTVRFASEGRLCPPGRGRKLSDRRGRIQNCVTPPRCISFLIWSTPRLQAMDPCRRNLLERFEKGCWLVCRE